MESITITLPIQALMCRKPDGSYHIARAEYFTVQVDAVARFLMSAFYLPIHEETAPKTIETRSNS